MSDDKMNIKMMKGPSYIIGFHKPDEPYGEFSNWYISKFNMPMDSYTSVEQYMMQQKVLLAREWKLADKIMRTNDPALIREYAGKKHFTSFGKIRPIWDKICKNVVKRGVRAKFAQNSELLRLLISTGNALLCECAESDTIWGIGINLHDDSWHDVSKWRGKNYLGRILMELRDEFRTEIKVLGSVQKENYIDASPIPVWKTRAGVLKRIPQYYTAIHTYADCLSDQREVDFFYYGPTLDRWDAKMSDSMGGGLTDFGFYEMKQEIYEIYYRMVGERI